MMNERIREILKQATQYADSLGPIDGAEWCDAEYSKFAELIVRECADRLNELGNPELGQGIKKHFGVEK
jgi:hypothetical protein